jgi:hypothetical protein
MNTDCKKCKSCFTRNNLLGGLLGNQNSNSSASLSLSNSAAEQMVNGLFNIVENYEKTNPENPMNILK